MRIRTPIIVLILFAVLTFWASPSTAQRQPAPGNDRLQDPLRNEVTLEDIQRLRQQIPTTDEAVKAEIEEILDRAEANLKQAADNRSTLSAHQAAKSQVAQQAEAFRQADPSERSDLKGWRSAELDELLRMVEEHAAWVEQAKKAASESAAEIGQRITRRQQIREKLSVVDQSKDELQIRIDSAEANETLIAKANGIEMQTKVQELESEAELLDAELRRLDAEDRVDLSRIKAEFHKNQSEMGQASLDEMQTRLNELHKNVAAEAKRQTQLSQLGSNPLLKDSFQKNLALAETNSEVTQQVTDIESRVKEKKDEYENLKDRFDDTRFRSRQIGLTGSIGAMLRNEKDQLLGEFGYPARPRGSGDFRDVKFQLFDIQKQLNDLGEETIADEALDSGNGDSSELSGLSDHIAQLVQQRKELLTAANTNYTRLYDQLLELELTESQLTALVKEYRTFINERILWSKSNDLLFTSLELDSGDMTVLRPSEWELAGEVIVRDWRSHYWAYLLIAIGALTLVWLKPRMRKAVDAFGVEASRGSCSLFMPTAKSFLLSTLIAIAIPLILLFLGWRLFQATRFQENPGELVVALGKALLAMSAFAIPVELLRRFCRKAGLGHMHFNWSDDAVKTLKFNLTWASPVGSLLVFVIALFYFLDTRHQNDLLERTAFLLGMLCLAFLLYRTMSPRIGIFRSYLRQHENSWATQLSFVWYGLLMSVPVALSVLTIVGYFYTALNLTACVFMTFVFGLMVETARALLMRFILVRRRHAHIELARRRRKSVKTEVQDSDGGEQGELAAAVGATLATDSELLEDFNVDESASQSQKLIALSMLVVWFLGLWMIWTDVLPALRALDRYPVWPPAESLAQDVSADSVSMGMDGSGTATETSNGETSPITRITVRDLLIFFLIAMITFVLARNLPSLIEMTFLNHLPVEPSVRYASKSILSYVIVLVGMVLAFRSIQVGWSQVQWLATALTFGLAFGLQEIFANFVAGIILLFERPIRIGDVITVDNITGVVTRIRTRATTVSNWDRKEYIIPNREFITGRVLNWTLSDQVNRIVIPVGVAYGTDVDRAKRILLSLCESHPKTIQDPPTRVTFEQFGDSSLQLIVRTFVPDVDCRLTVIDQLHSQINEAFEEAGIEISFPQMDLHVRSIEGQASQNGAGLGKPE